jgi:DNA-binding CsgD family transcriptional regulator
MHLPTIIRELLQLRCTVALIKISQLSDALLSVIRNISMFTSCAFFACGYKNEGFPKSLVLSFQGGNAMTTFDMNSEACDLPDEAERLLASFTQRLVEIAAVSGARGSDTSPTSVLNAMRLPAIALDRHGFVIEANAAAEDVFDENIKIKDRRIFVRDPDARTLFKEAVAQLKELPNFNAMVSDPLIVPRMDKLPIIVRVWPFEGPSRLPEQDVRALLTLNAIGPKSGPSATILAKTFYLTPSEAKLAGIIARGAPPVIAAHELKISREMVRNQLKSVFAKTNTHRQSELVALLMQVG